MTHLIEFALDSGGSALVEATERTAGPVAAVGSTANFAVALTWRRSEESAPPEPGLPSEM